MYEQLNSLSKHNPWFVQSLQNIMASTALTESVQGRQPPGSGSGLVNGSTTRSIPTANGLISTPAVPSSADPAQAALILLLAGRVNKAPPEQTANLLQDIVKQMSMGVNATEILKNVIPSLSPGTDLDPNVGRDDPKQLIQTAINLATGQTTPSSTSAEATTGTRSATSGAKSDKCPLLMDLLYKSFQAKLAKEQRMKSFRQQHQSHGHHLHSSSRSHQHHDLEDATSSTSSSSHLKSSHSYSNSSSTHNLPNPHHQQHLSPRSSAGRGVSSGLVNPARLNSATTTTSVLPPAGKLFLQAPGAAVGTLPAVNANNNHLTALAASDAAVATMAAMQQQLSQDQHRQFLAATALPPQPQLATPAPPPTTPAPRWPTRQRGS